MYKVNEIDTVLGYANIFAYMCLMSCLITVLTKGRYI